MTLDPDVLSLLVVFVAMLLAIGIVVKKVSEGEFHSSSALLVSSERVALASRPNHMCAFARSSASHDLRAAVSTAWV